LGHAALTLPALALLCLPLQSHTAQQAFIDKFRFNAKRASLVQSRIKALERMAEVEVTGVTGV
jgi:ATPase subunit of ABC transporter with duplicated ATPase domains